MKNTVELNKDCIPWHVQSFTASDTVVKLDDDMSSAERESLVSGGTAHLWAVMIAIPMPQDLLPPERGWNEHRAS